MEERGGGGRGEGERGEERGEERGVRRCETRGRARDAERGAERRVSVQSERCSQYTGTWHAHGTSELATELAQLIWQRPTGTVAATSMAAEGSAASRRDGCKDADAVADAVARRRRGG